MTLDFRLEQSVDASLEHAWEACATARGLERWQVDAVRGKVERGGHVELTWRALGASLPVRVTAFVEGEEIAFDSGGSRIRMLLSPGRVVLEHEGLEPDDDAEGVASSWRVSLALLAHSLEKHPGRDRRAVWLIDAAHTSAATAHAFFSEPAALATWLGTGVGIGPEGSRVSLRCPWGDHIGGSVLTNTPGRDLAVSWHEDDDSVLCLRTLPSPRSEDERLVVVYWSRWSTSDPPGERQQGLSAALGRLTRTLDRSADA